MTEQMNETLATRDQKQIISLNLTLPEVQNLFREVEDFFTDGTADHIAAQISLVHDLHRSNDWEDQYFKKVYTSIHKQSDFLKRLAPAWKLLADKYLEEDRSKYPKKFILKGGAVDLMSFSSSDESAMQFFNLMGDFFNDFGLEERLHDQHVLCCAFFEVNRQNSAVDESVLSNGCHFHTMLVALWLAWVKFMGKYKNVLLTREVAFQ